MTYMQHGIPAVMFITWPDMWYHSSQDTPDKQDPTQYKRAAAVGTGALAALASGTDEMAARILSENIGRGLSRMGESHTKGLGYMADATNAAALTDGYKEARIAILHQAEVEKGVVNSASILWTNVEQRQAKDGRLCAADRPARLGAVERSEGRLSTPGDAARRAGFRTRHDGPGTRSGQSRRRIRGRRRPRRWWRRRRGRRWLAGAAAILVPRFRRK